MGRGAWWATGPGVEKNLTRLKQLSIEGRNALERSYGDPAEWAGQATCWGA